MSIRRLISWTLIAILGFPPGALAQQQTGNDSTLLIDRGSTGTMSPAGGASTRAQSDPFTGAAALGFELRVPPGTGGMQPALALAYNNQRRADSWVGYGWSLSLGSIRRSLKRGIPSYDDEKDRFELDGQELVPDNAVANRFHTRRESFVRIDRLPSGAWEVRTKDGRVARFGTTEQSRIQRADGGVYEWLLAETEDLRGNAFTVAYDRADSGTAYPLEVRYTLRRQAERLVPMGGAASERVVRFVTEPRPDPSRAASRACSRSRPSVSRASRSRRAARSCAAMTCATCRAPTACARCSPTSPSAAPAPEPMPRPSPA